MNASKPDQKSSVVPKEIRALLEQRGTYQEWMSRLGEVQSRYRSEVAERVRSDYQTRLREVGDELEGHRDELGSSLEEKRGRLDELATRFEDLSAELEEAELRFQVGEFDEPTWEQKRTEHTAEIEDIETGLGEARSAVEELDRVLNQLSGESPRHGAEALAALGASAAGDARPEVTPPGAGAPADADATDAGDAPMGGIAPGTDRLTTAAADAAAAAERAADPAAASERAADAAAAAERAADAAAAAERAADPAAAADRAADRDAAAEEAEAETGEGDEVEAADAVERQDGSAEYLDELAFLESLSLDDTESFDAVSRMLEDEEDR